MTDGFKNDIQNLVNFHTSSVYVLAERMYFLDKGSPSNFSFLDFPLLVSSCPSSSCGFWNQESIFV